MVSSVNSRTLPMLISTLEVEIRKYNNDFDPADTFATAVWNLAKILKTWKEDKSKTFFEVLKYYNAIPSHIYITNFTDDELFYNAQLLDRRDLIYFKLPNPTNSEISRYKLIKELTDDEIKLIMSSNSSKADKNYGHVINEFQLRERCKE